jgi:hypothetical protein
MSPVDNSVERRLEKVQAAVDLLSARTERTILGPVSSRDIMRFAVASSDPNPLYPDRTPPLFLPALVGWGRQEYPHAGAYRADGTPRGDALLETLPLEGLRSVGGSQTVRLGPPVRDNVVVTREESLTGFSLKYGRSGPLGVVAVRRIYIDEYGIALGTCDDEMLLR